MVIVLHLIKHLQINWWVCLHLCNWKGVVHNVQGGFLWYFPAKDSMLSVHAMVPVTGRIHCGGYVFISCLAGFSRALGCLACKSCCSYMAREE